MATVVREPNEPLSYECRRGRVEILMGEDEPTVFLNLPALKHGDKIIVALGTERIEITRAKKGYNALDVRHTDEMKLAPKRQAGPATVRITPPSKGNA